MAGCDASDRASVGNIPLHCGECHPEKSMDKNGRYLLHHIASDANKLPWDQCVKEIVNANCNVLGIKDSITGLLPFMLSARGCNLTCSFEMFRTKPDVLEGIESRDDGCVNLRLTKRQRV